MVDIRIKRLSKFNSKIVIDKLSCSVANSLRRIMISEVPTLSIDLELEAYIELLVTYGISGKVLSL